MNHNGTVRFDYDMIVIGGGAAGLVAAGMSAMLGAKTVLVESRRNGGECTWTGCIPSKALLRAAHAAHEMRSAGRFGLKPVEPEICFEDVMARVRDVRQRIYEEADAPPRMEKLGVETLAGRAKFLDGHTVAVETGEGPVRRITAKYFVIATGSRPKVPDFKAPLCLTSETLFELKSLPQRLVVMGAGPMGVEMAQAFGRLGSRVTIVSASGQILPRDDAEHAGMLAGVLRAEGIGIESGTRVTGLDTLPGECLVATLDDGRAICCDAVLAAIGRQPNIEDLGLASAGVLAGADGIQVDTRCRTSRKHIFAAGDVTGRYQFTHMAEHMSKIAVTNAVLRWPRRLDERHVVWTTFCSPEVARLGGHTGGDRVYRFPFSKLDRAITDCEPVGEVKVRTDRAGTILGASIVGARAGEMIAEYALAMKNGVRIAQLAETIHSYPTYAMANRRAADAWHTRQLDSRALVWLGRLLGYRGRPGLRM